MRNAFPNPGSGDIVLRIAGTIVSNRAYLSEIDGLIGDGDHGVNMAKGFKMAAERIGERDLSLGEAMAELGDVLINEIGGSMGPLYGMFFSGMADDVAGLEEIDAKQFAAMLRTGLENIRIVGNAKVGDKTLLDTLVPAIDAFEDNLGKLNDFPKALDALSTAAEAGKDSTAQMVAKVGRASRLGERSRGVLDAGATSCFLILRDLATGTKAKLTAG